MDLPVPDGVGYDEAACSHMEKPPERSNDSSCITLSVIIRDPVTHHLYPYIPASEEASTYSTAG